jgi:hypothetical protein
MAVAIGSSQLLPHLPQVLVPALFAAPTVLAGFAGTALAVAAADPQASRDDGSPRPRVAAAR